MLVEDRSEERKYCLYDAIKLSGSGNKTMKKEQPTRFC